MLLVDSTSRNTGSGGKPSSVAAAPTAVYLEFQHKLEKYLRGSQPTTEDACHWIQVCFTLAFCIFILRILTNKSLLVCISRNNVWLKATRLLFVP